MIQNGLVIPKLKRLSLNESTLRNNSLEYTKRRSAPGDTVTKNAITKAITDNGDSLLKSKAIFRSKIHLV